MKQILPLFLFYSATVFAFNSKKCKALYDDFKAGGVEHLVVHRIGNSMTSTTQFLSSFGECAALGSREEERNHYFVFNYSQLKADIAKGNGEYLEGLFSFFDCGKSNLVKTKLKSEYRNISMMDLIDSRNLIFNEIEYCQ